MNVNELKVEKLPAGGGRHPRLAWYSVSHQGKLVGFLEKLQNDRSSKAYNASRGDKLRFKATLEASKDDPSFGFGKRPVVCESAVAA